MKHITSIMLAAFAALATAQTPPVPTGPPWTNLAKSRTTQKLDGWTIRVDDRLLKGPDKKIGDWVLKLLDGHLVRIIGRVAPDKVKWMQDHVPIVVDDETGDMHGPVYHPSADWLKEHGYDPSVGRCVNIANARYFLRRDFEFEQPLAILHEMSHAYHDQVLGFDDPEIIAAYKKFVASGKYQKTMRNSSKVVPHYALTNEKEFFAEMSESYFGDNDFYPFNQAELKRDEPELYKMMARIWGPAPGPGLIGFPETTESK
jgi:hypothetical protein